MTLSSKQLIGMLAVLVVGAGGTFLAREASPQIFTVAIVGLVAIALSGTGASPASLHRFVEAARRASLGERPNVPPESVGETLRLYEVLADTKRRPRDRELTSRRSPRAPRSRRARSSR
jgi:hypothetical protein